MRNADRTTATTQDATTDDVEGFAWFAKFDGVDGESQSVDHDKWVLITQSNWSAPAIGGLTGLGWEKTQELRSGH